MPEIYHTFLNEIHICYYGETPFDVLHLKDLSNIQSHKIYGYLQFIPHKEEGKLYISGLYVASDYRNQGIGSCLIDFIVDYCLLTHINDIHVDDMSDNFRTSNNIYVKNGFEYDSDTGPEMTLSLGPK